MVPAKADAQAIPARPFLITFSGIDGAGKTTQIERVSSFLEKQGLRVLRLSFWDHVAVWSKMRAGVGQRTLDTCSVESEAEGIFRPKNGKHVRKWYLTTARSGLYVLDVARLHRLLASQRIRSSDVVIFDRYVYDQIANIGSRSVAARAYCEILLKLSPVPDLAFILDASPSAAFARKPEYPLEFMYENRRSFLRLKEQAPHMIIVSDAAPECVTVEIHAHIGRSRLAEAMAAEPKIEVTSGKRSSLAEEFL